MKWLLCAVVTIAFVAAAQAREVLVPPGQILTLAPSWSTTDLRTGTPLPSGETTVNQVTVKWQIGNYWSDGLRIYGLLCEPVSLPGPYPVAILNHGLEFTQTGPTTFVYPAIMAYGLTGCTTMAANGWLAAISTYRGEYISETVSAPRIIVGGRPLIPLRPYTYTATSDGNLELCLGEVDDVLNLLSAVRGLPQANAGHVLMWGHSHGSCITERAIERGAPVQIAVTIDGPTDFTTWSNNNLFLAPTAADQQARSSAYPGNDPAKLAGLNFLRIHAEGDTTVTPDQGCELASRLPNLAAYYLNSSVSPPGTFAGAPPECAAFAVPWLHGQLLPDAVSGGQWAHTSFLMYSGLTHVTILINSWPEFSSFVNAVTSSENWHASVPAQFSVMEN
jgi:hypothetical protein